MESPGIGYKPYWVGYFDLLGFRNRVKRNQLATVLADYLDALAEIKKQGRDVTTKWFSDTFLFFATDDSKDSFCKMDFACRLFFQRMILHRIPLRGSLTVGDLYVESSDVLIGPALVEAYDYAERQDWLGFILTPAACEKLKRYDPDGKTVYDVWRQHYYRDYDVPIKPRYGSEAHDTENLPACTMNFTRAAHGNDNPDEARRVWDALLDMEQMATDELQDRHQYERAQACGGQIQNEMDTVRRKYERTKRFLSDTVPGLLNGTGGK